MHYIERIEYKKFEPYWKYDDMYEIEFEVSFSDDYTQVQFDNFIYSISDKWIDSGYSVIASEMAEGCTYIKDGIGLIEICYDE